MSKDQDDQNSKNKARFSTGAAPLNEYTISHSELEYELAREKLYAFLASVYLQPASGEFLKQVREVSLFDSLCELFAENSATQLKAYFQMLKPEAIEQEATVLKRVYMDLFSVPTGAYVAPYEDIYRGKSLDGQTLKGPLLGVRAIAAKRIYREAGARMEETCRELPTHIGVELSFMRFLCAQEIMHLNDGQTQSDDSSDETPSQAEVYRGYQLRFLAEHLTRWFPLLNEEIQHKSGHIFYKSLAQLTHEFLLADFEILKNDMIFSAAENAGRVHAAQ